MAFGASLGSGRTKVEFFPDNKPNQIIVYIEYPQGTDIDKTNAITKDIEKIVNEVNKKLVAYKKIEKITVVNKPMAMTSTKKIQRGKVSRTIGRLRGNG